MSLNSCIICDISGPVYRSRVWFSYPNVSAQKCKMLLRGYVSVIAVLSSSKQWSYTWTTQAERSQTCCKLRTSQAGCKLSASFSKPVEFIKLHQALGIADLLQLDICRLAASCYNNLHTASLWVTSSGKPDRTISSKPVKHINADAGC